MNKIHPNESIRVSEGDSSYCTTFHSAQETWNFTGVETIALEQGVKIVRGLLVFQRETHYQQAQAMEQGRKLHEEILGEWPSLDDQINFIRRKLDHHVYDQRGKPAQMYRAIEDNLCGIKRWNESQVYHGKVDVVKVLEDLLIAYRSTLDPDDPNGRWGEDNHIIQNAEAAIGMIQAFRQQREKPTVDMKSSGTKVYDNSYPGQKEFERKFPNSAHGFTEGSEQTNSDVSDVLYETYAPLRLGKWRGKDPKSNAEFVCIVSDTKTSHQGNESELEYYGGYLVAESVPYHLALQIIEAYNEKFMLKSYEHKLRSIVNELTDDLANSFNANAKAIIGAIEAMMAIKK